MYKCQLCNDKFTEIEDLYGHLEEEHHDSIPKDFSVSQYYYYLKTGREHGRCVVCKMDTAWNEGTKKYHRFCSMPKCKEQYKEQFKKNMIGKHGRVHLLNDPEQQKKMLANRSISGKYKWSDGKEIGYTGSYELDFLRFLDNIMEFSSDDIMSPSPHTYYYIYQGEEKFYIPDFFIPSLNLEIEIKDGGSNPNNHHKIQGVDKVKEKLKDAVLTSQKEFSYIKLTDKKYDAFFKLLIDMKEDFQEHGERTKPIFILTESLLFEENNSSQIVTESMGDITRREWENNKKFGTYRLFHLSESNLDGEILYPRIPDNFMTKHGYEENKTPRISFSSDIEGCLVGMSQNLEGKELFIHEPVDYGSLEAQQVTKQQVPDAHLTHELWVTTPVKLRQVGKIQVLNAHARPMTYTYGPHTAETYGWKWKYIQPVGPLFESYQDDDIVQESLYAQTQMVLTYLTSTITGKVHREKLEEALASADSVLASPKVKNAKEGMFLAFKVQVSKIRAQIIKRLKKDELFPE